MSLDVYLTEPEESACRECGHVAPRPVERFSWNVTHNLAEMAEAAGIYKPLWRPEECDPPITKASQLIGHLTDGLVQLKAYPDKFKALNPSNGWGSYEGLVGFVERYLAACEEFPDADVSVSR